jgi:carbonic anhydrase
MLRRSALKILAGLALCPLCERVLFADESHWNYEGLTGPDYWGRLDAASSLCSTGDQESPLDINDTIDAPLPPLMVSWPRRPDTVENNGHTVQLNFVAGNRLTVGNRSYALAQFHFHHPSEHLLRGERFAMEAHFVHADRNDLAVIGVLMTPGSSNAAFSRIVSTMPATERPPSPADQGDRSERAAAEPARLLPVRGIVDDPTLQRNGRLVPDQRAY